MTYTMERIHRSPCNNRSTFELRSASQLSQPQRRLHSSSNCTHPQSFARGSCKNRHSNHSRSMHSTTHTMGRKRRSPCNNRSTFELRSANQLLQPQRRLHSSSIRNPRQHNELAKGTKARREPMKPRCRLVGPRKDPHKPK